METNCLSKLMSLCLCIVILSKLHAQTIPIDSLKQFYIIDTIMIQEPNLLYVNETVKGMDKFTPILLSRNEAKRAIFDNQVTAEQILLRKECFVLKDYNDLVSILNRSSINVLPQTNDINLSKDSCYSKSKHISCCNLIGLKANRFVIALEKVDHYNYYRILEHKTLSTDIKYVLVAFPIEW